MGTIETTCAVMTSLLRGHVYDRRSLARDFGVTVATADRYIRHLLNARVLDHRWEMGDRVVSGRGGNPAGGGDVEELVKRTLNSFPTGGRQAELTADAEKLP